MGDGIVAAGQRDEAPQPERESIDHRAELITRLPNAPPASAVSCARCALILSHVERAQRAGHDEERDARPEPDIAGLQRRHERRDRSTKRAGEQRARILEQRIRSAPRKSTATSSDRLLRFCLPTASAAHASCLERSSTDSR